MGRSATAAQSFWWGPQRAPQPGDSVQRGPNQDAGEVCTVEQFPAPYERPLKPLTFPLPQEQRGPMVKAATYLGADGKPREGFDPANAHYAVQLGMTGIIKTNSPLGITWEDVSPNWETAGLAEMGAFAKNWRIAFRQAIHHTNTINFIITGMNVVIPKQEKFVRANPSDSEAFWEMDIIIQDGYLDKLHLWDRGRELSAEEKTLWIRSWRNIRTHP